MSGNITGRAQDFLGRADDLDLAESVPDEFSIFDSETPAGDDPTASS